MTLEQEITIGGISYPITLSEETQALLTAKAAGRVVVGLVAENVGEGKRGGLFSGNSAGLSAPYLLTLPETFSPSLSEEEGRKRLREFLAEPSVRRYLERAVCWERGLPWTVAESERLRIREFCLADLPHIPREPEEREGDRIFHSPDMLCAYIRRQYGFFEYGIWAIVRKSDGRLLGKAGVSPWEDMPGEGSSDEFSAGPPGGVLESVPDGIREGDSGALALGYHIFAPYRRQGYGEEACRLILDYLKEEYDVPGGTALYAVTEADNAASVGLLGKLGFRLTARRYNGAGRLCFLYGPNC